MSIQPYGNLTPELWKRIFTYLDRNDREMVARVSTLFRKWVMEIPSLPITESFKSLKITDATVEPLCSEYLTDQEDWQMEMCPNLLTLFPFMENIPLVGKEDLINYDFRNDIFPCKSSFIYLFNSNKSPVLRGESEGVRFFAIRLCIKVATIKTDGLFILTQTSISGQVRQLLEELYNHIEILSQLEEMGKNRGIDINSLSHEINQTENRITDSEDHLKMWKVLSTQDMRVDKASASNSCLNFMPTSVNAWNNFQMTWMQKLLSGEECGALSGPNELSTKNNHFSYQLWKQN